MAGPVDHAHGAAARDRRGSGGPRTWLRRSGLPSSVRSYHSHGGACNDRPMSSRPGRRLTRHERYDQRHDDRLRAGARASPAGAARPLLPDARLLRGGRGRAAGGVPARVAGARDATTERRRAARVAVQDRHQRLPRRAAAQQAPGPDARVQGRRAVAAALPGPAAGRGRADRGAAGRRRRRARDDRAHVHRADPAAAGAPARGRDPARRARLVGGRDRRAAGHQRRRRPTARSSAGATTLRDELPERPSERPAPPSSPTTSSGCWQASSPPTRRATRRPRPR